MKKITNDKLQIPSKFQAPMFKISDTNLKRFVICDFEYCDLFGI